MMFIIPSCICIDFDGFENFITGITDIPTVEGGSVSLLCDYREAMPIPEVTWYMNDGGGNVIVAITDAAAVVENRYLILGSLTATQRNANYFCVVSNAYLSTNPQTAPTTYSLSRVIPGSDFPESGVIVHKQVTQVTTTVGSIVPLVYPITFEEPPEFMPVLVCRPTIPVKYSGNGLFGSVSGLQFTGVVNLPCYVGTRFILFSYLVQRELLYVVHAASMH